MKGSRYLPYLCFWSWRPSQALHYHSIRGKSTCYADIQKVKPLSCTLNWGVFISTHIYHPLGMDFVSVGWSINWTLTHSSNITIKKLLWMLSELIICEYAHSRSDNACVWGGLLSFCGQQCGHGECTKFFIFLYGTGIFIQKNNEEFAWHDIRRNYKLCILTGCLLKQFLN